MRDGLAEYLRSHPHRGSIIVHRERKIIYMKSAKTAGTSILRRTLEPMVGGFIHEKDYSDPFSAWLSDIDDTALTEYFIFSVVRNPWDRFSSLASYFDIPLKRLCADFTQLCAENESLAEHALPQHLYTHMGGRQFCDHIVSFENLDDEMQPVFDRLGISVKQLIKVNQSQRNHYSVNFETAEIDWIRAHFRTDVDIYGYEFEAAPSRSVFSRIIGAFS